MAHDDIEALARIVAQGFGLVGVGNVLGIGGLKAVRLKALQNSVAEGIPALIVDAAGQQNGGLVFGSGWRRECR